jgi:hypothetical protein
MNTRTVIIGSLSTTRVNTEIEETTATVLIIDSDKSIEAGAKFHYPLPVINE